MTVLDTDRQIGAFIARWAKSSAAERANFQMFAFELCGLLGVAASEPARGEEAELNDYCFERGVVLRGRR